MSYLSVLAELIQDSLKVPVLQDVIGDVSLQLRVPAHKINGQNFRVKISQNLAHVGSDIDPYHHRIIQL